MNLEDQILKIVQYNNCDCAFGEPCKACKIKINDLLALVSKAEREKANESRIRTLETVRGLVRDEPGWLPSTLDGMLSKAREAYRTTLEADGKES